jgi:heme-degrading monooxygenase HmoA
LAVFMELELSGMTTDQYEQIDNALDVKGDPPPGFIAHSARLDGDTLRVLDIWESEQDFENFLESRLGPTIGQTVGDDMPEAPQPKFTELHRAYSA